jgi:hypothetical protein
MVINIWIIKDTDVDESLYQKFVELLIHDFNERNPKIQFNLIATKTRSNDKGEKDNAQLAYCNLLRDELKISKSIYLVYLTSSIINEKISDRDINNNIVVLANYNEKAKANKILSFVLYLFTRELLNYDNNINSVQRDVTRFSYENEDSNDYYKYLSEQVDYIFNIFPGERNDILTLIEKLKKERLDNRSLNDKERNRDIEILNLVTRLIKWLYRRPLLNDKDFVKVEVAINERFIFYFSNDETLVIKLEAKLAAFYAFFLLWCQDIEKNFTTLTQNDIDVFTRMYEYYDRPNQINHRINIRFSFPRAATQTAREINDKLSNEITKNLGYEINSLYEYYFHVRHTSHGYIVRIPKNIIHIDDSHRLRKHIHPENKSKIKIMQPILGTF